MCPLKSLVLSVAVHLNALSNHQAVRHSRQQFQAFQAGTRAADTYLRMRSLQKQSITDLKEMK